MSYAGTGRGGCRRVIESSRASWAHRGGGMEPHQLVDDVPDELRELENARQRAFLVALVLYHGRSTRAAQAAGVSYWTTRRWEKGDPWKGTDPDPAYLEALAAARELAADHLEDVVATRAIEGQRSYKFAKDGTPLQHPELCDCGHQRTEHALVRPEAPEEPEDPWRGSCTECSCERFEGAPYFEDQLSDKLAEFMLRGAKPDKYAKRVQQTTSLRNINWEALASTPGGQAAIARLARGEHPYSVFASLAEAGAGRMLAPGVELGGPGAAAAEAGDDGGGGVEEAGDAAGDDATAADG